MSAAFEKAFRELTGRGMEPYRVWSLFVNVTAVSLADCVGLGEPFDRAPLGQAADVMEELSLMYWHMADEFEANPEQDFLGAEYMALGISDSGKGQFFTPYHLARVVAATAIRPEGVARAIDERGFVTLMEPAVGGGAMAIAAFNRLRELGHNPQTQAWFEMHELSWDTAMACYCQAATLGMAGCVVVGDTLSDAPGRRLWLPMDVMEPLWSTRLLSGRLVA